MLISIITSFWGACLSQIWIWIVFFNLLQRSFWLFQESIIVHHNVLTILIHFIFILEPNAWDFYLLVNLFIISKIVFDIDIFSLSRGISFCIYFGIISTVLWVYSLFHKIVRIGFQFSVCWIWVLISNWFILFVIIILIFFFDFTYLFQYVYFAAALVGCLWFN